MDRPIDDETAPLTPTYGIPSSVRDNRQPNQKRLAVYVILTSTLFERIAYYALSATLAITADPIQCPSSKGPIAALIFTGKRYMESENIVRLRIIRYKQYFDGDICGDQRLEIRQSQDHHRW